MSSTFGEKERTSGPFGREGIVDGPPLILPKRGPGANWIRRGPAVFSAGGYLRCRINGATPVIAPTPRRNDADRTPKRPCPHAGALCRIAPPGGAGSVRAWPARVSGPEQPDRALPGSAKYVESTGSGSLADHRAHRAGLSVGERSCLETSRRAIDAAAALGAIDRPGAGVVAVRAGRLQGHRLPSGCV